MSRSGLNVLLDGKPIEPRQFEYSEYVDPPFGQVYTDALSKPRFGRTSTGRTSRLRGSPIQHRLVNTSDGLVTTAWLAGDEAPE